MRVYGAQMRTGVHARMSVCEGACMCVCVRLHVRSLVGVRVGACR